MSRRPGAVQRRQRLAGATVLGLAVAFIWSGVPDLLAAQIAAARLGFADVVVLLLVAALVAGFTGAVGLLLLADVIELRRQWIADRRADEDRRALRSAPADPDRLMPATHRGLLLVLPADEDVLTMRGGS